MISDIFIKQIEIYKSKIRLKEPFITSLGLHEFAENIIIKIKTNNGICGFGECSPFMTINGESMDTCFVVAHYFAKELNGKNPLDIASCVHTMDKIIYGNTSIKSAFDIALYDIASQHAGLPLYAFLGGKKNKKLFTDYTVSLNEPDIMADDAQLIKEKGFHFIKVKLGESKEKDLQRVISIRNRIGYDIPLRVDANQGWDLQSAKEILEALSNFNIQYCEEPLPRWNFMQLYELKKRSTIPVMADESCCDHHDAKRLIELSACDYFNVKLGKSSGIFNAIKIITLADKSNMKMQIGGFLESRLGFTAAAHLTFTSENILFYDFDTPLMFAEDPVFDGIIYGPNGSVDITDMPGLGASVDPEYLKKLEGSIIN